MPLSRAYGFGLFELAFGYEHFYGVHEIGVHFRRAVDGRGAFHEKVDGYYRHDEQYGDDGYAAPPAAGYHVPYGLGFDNRHVRCQSGGRIGQGIALCRDVE